MTSSFCPFCGADNPPGEAHCLACHQALARQEVIALLHERYEVITAVGAGGFGAVYKARDTQEQNRLVAVKQINLKKLSAQEIIEATDAFNREAEILAVLSHPLLPRIFDRFSDPEHWYLVMNFIDGQTLEEYLQSYTGQRVAGQSGLSLEETLAIGQQLCDVLLYLHKQHPPIIFRDLKPGNIMRTRRGQLYLIDFGIARRFKPGQAKDTTPFGSPGFASPEQYGRAQTTPQADIYSLGALLYCLLSGDDPSEHPFQFASLRLSGVNGMRQLNTLIQCMVALAPEDRPATIQEVQNELRQIQRLFAQASTNHIWTPPQSQIPPSNNGSAMQHIMLNSSALPTSRKTSRRRVLTVGLVAAGVLTGGGLVVHSQLHTAPVNVQGTVDSPTSTANAQDARIIATETSSMAVLPLNGPAYWSSDLSRAVIVNFEQKQLEIYAVQGSTLLSKIPLPDADFDNTIGVRWSPDMSKILVFSGAGGAAIYEAHYGTLLCNFPQTWAFQRIFTSTSQTIFPGAWSPDGNYFALSYSGATGTHFVVLSANDGQQLFADSAVDYTYDSLAWSPDSMSIAFASITVSDQTSEAWVIKLWNRETRQVTGALNGLLTDNPTAYRFGNIQDSITSISWVPGGRQLCAISQQAMWICVSSGGQQTVPVLKNTDPLYGLISDPIWSPNKNYLAALANEGLNIYDLATQQMLPLPVAATSGRFVACAWSMDGKALITVDDENIQTHWSVV